MYWVLFVCALLLPLLMLCIGLRWKKHPPGRSFFLAYRTELSQKTDETWRFAHWYVGKLWARSGLVLLAITVTLLLLLPEHYMTLIMWLVAAQGGLCAFSLMPAEGALRQRFHDDGSPKEAAPPT